MKESIFTKDTIQFSTEKRNQSSSLGAQFYSLSSSCWCILLFLVTTTRERLKIQPTWSIRSASYGNRPEKKRVVLNAFSKPRWQLKVTSEELSVSISKFLLNLEALCVWFFFVVLFETGLIYVASCFGKLRKKSLWQPLFSHDPGKTFEQWTIHQKLGNDSHEQTQTATCKLTVLWTSASLLLVLLLL